MAQAKVYNASSGSVSSEEVDVAALGEGARRRLLKSAVVRYQNNLRHGTHSTKTRGEINRTGKKPFRQKGTGRARAGDFASPIWKGGGTVFGPKPRSYRSGMPKKARREALRSAIQTKFADEQACYLQDVSWDKPSTKSAAQALQALGALEGGALIVLAEPNETLVLSFRNLTRVDVVSSANVNAYDVLRRRHLVFVGDGALPRFGGAGGK